MREYDGPNLGFSGAKLLPARKTTIWSGIFTTTLLIHTAALLTKSRECT
jgi:hypothetical protein